MLQLALNQRIKEANTYSFQHGILTDTSRCMENLEVGINVCKTPRNQHWNELDDAMAAAAAKTYPSTRF